MEKIKKILKPLTDDEVKWIVKFARKIMKKHGCEFYADYLTVKTFNSKKFFARACRSDAMCGSYIEISLPWWRKLAGWQKEELIAHETCHIIVEIKNLEDPRNHHGEAWSNLMIKSGYKASKSYHW